MIKQPELGKQIADLRKEKGLTQEELVEKCNLSVRTLQRIEAGEVEPRSYTVKLILDALDSNLDFFTKGDVKNIETKLLKWLEQFYKYILDLFDLKTHKMKKLSVLSLGLFAIVFSLAALSNHTKTTSTKKVKTVIEESNKNFIEWFNNGNIELLTALYHEDACLVSRGCGKTFIKNYYEAESRKYKFVELTILDLSVSKSMAVEKGKWKIRFDSGDEVGGEYLTEWKFSDGKWLMFSDLPGITD